MGLLVGENSQTLAFQESRQFQRLLKVNAALQLTKLLSIFEHFTKSSEEALMFGTELECHLLKKVELKGQSVYSVYIDSKPIMAEVNKRFPELEVKEEFSAWMMEFIPKNPFKGFLNLSEIRDHFRLIDSVVEAFEGKLTLLPGLSVLPHIGTANYYLEESDKPGSLVKRAEDNVFSQSDFFLDSTITQHSRFKTFTANTRLRAGKKPEIVLPILHDKNTVAHSFSLDHFGFGMCNTALQITYSCRDLKQARWAHDMMHVLSPFMLAFSSTTFAASHRLLDFDNRFRIIEQSTDDRKPTEKQVIDKTRYSTINFYLSDSPKLKRSHNDKKATINKRFFKLIRKLLKEKKSKLANDKQLLVHFAYLFVRDFLIVFPERCHKGYVGDSLDFEAIQSSNWNDMRLKPPSSFDSKLGWLLEFRCMDAPLTEIEKSILTYVTTLLFRIVTSDKIDVDFYVPMSKVDENFKRAFLRDSTTKQKFFFRRHFCSQLPGHVNNQEVVELTLAEFWEGNGQFAGMGALIDLFVSVHQKELLEASKSTGEDVIGTIRMAQMFLGGRATGKLTTAPNYFRDFVFGHKHYQNDSHIDDTITTDVIDLAKDLVKQNTSSSMFGGFKFGQSTKH